MKKGTFTLPTLQEAQNLYDNIGAYNQLKAMMKAGQKLSVKFYTGKDNKPCAWIESKQVKGFRYELKEVSFSGLINYLITSEAADFDASPMETQPLAEGSNYALLVLKLMLEEHWGVQFTPLFRERSNYITAQKAFRKGIIFFRIPRTEENLELIREYGIAI
ncbi:MAG: hypothetical protein HXO12_03650 [Prevotella salivae]|nr:hypothetical protein [Segatella salivae]